MDMRLLEIYPQELKFIFEPKKQSSCSIQLTNNTHNRVAFKVKTTSPRKYCVRPKVGIIMPKSTCEFTVQMQAQVIAPPDMICKDKFLIQSIIVSSGTTDEDINSTLFAKDGSRYIEEKKLSVILVGPSNSPVVSPIDGALKEGMVHGVSEPSNLYIAVEEDLDHETSKLNDEIFNGVDSLPPNYTVPEDVMEPRNVSKEESEPTNLAVFKQGDEKDLERVKHVEELKLVNNIGDMKLKLNELELKLCEAQVDISKLIEEKRISTQEIKFLQEKFSELSKREVEGSQVGFPLLYVCMVALVCIFLGYLLH